MKYPAALVLNNHQRKIAKNQKTIFCYAYPQDLDNAYSFYCARYKDISFKEFMNLGLFEFKKKLNSMPESEPLSIILKSRTININKIKDKGERTYWKQQKRLNEIPPVFLSRKELDADTNSKMKSSKI